MFRNKQLLERLYIIIERLNDQDLNDLLSVMVRGGEKHLLAALIDELSSRTFHGEL